MQKFLYIVPDIIFVLLLCVLFFFVKPCACIVNNSGDFISIGNQKIKVTIVDTPQTLERGLSGKASLAKGTGMLFVFEKPDRYGFWMKEMNFPIDIIWISLDKKIVDIKDSAKPESFPEVFYPKENALYVLEVEAGFVKNHEIKPGDEVVI